MKVEKMNIPVVDSNLVDPPGDQGLDRIDPDSADSKLALIRTGTRHKIDFWSIDDNGGPLGTVKNLRPLERNIPAGRIKEMNRNIPRPLIKMNIVNIQAGGPGMDANPFHPSVIIR